VLGVWLTSSRGAGFALLVGIVILVATSVERSRQFVAVLIGSLGALVLIVVAQLLPDLTAGVTDSAMRSDGDLMSVVCLPVTAAIGALAWWADERQPKLHVSRRAALISGVVLLAAIVVGVVAADPSKRLHAFEKAPPTHAGVAVGAADLSSNGRWQFWGEAIDALADNPLDGVGAGAPCSGGPLRAQSPFAPPPAGL
jgi:O-antigen ligase